MPTALNRLVRALLHQDRPGGSNDGLDAAIFVYDPATRRLTYAGARAPLILQAPGGTIVRCGDHGSLGYRPRGRAVGLTSHSAAEDDLALLGGRTGGGTPRMPA